MNTETKKKLAVKPVHGTKRKMYRVLCLVGSHVYVNGFGLTPAEAIANFKKRLDGHCIKNMLQLLEEDDSRIAHGERMVFHRYEESLGGMFDFQKEFLRNNGRVQTEYFDEEYDSEREEWRTTGGDFWNPKFPIKF